METRQTESVDRRIHLAELVDLKFASERFGSSPQRILKLFDPEGASQEAGRMNRQSIVLVPESESNVDGSGNGLIVVGWFDAFQRSAELRSYSSVSERFLERYGSPIDMTRVEYGAFLDSLMSFLHALQFRTRMAHSVRARRKPPTPVAQPRSHTSLAAAAGGALFGFALCYALFIFKLI